MTVDYAHYESPLDSPIGPLVAAVTTRGLCALCFGDYWERQRRDLERWLGPVPFRETAPRLDLARCLEDYFAGALTALDGLEVDLHGTAFQRRVWSALRRVPAGTTTSYHELAEQVGCRGGARAVGAANGANPVALVIPCHRVIRADGGLCGYGGGVARKEWLLRHEGVRISSRKEENAFRGVPARPRNATEGVA
jgi:methylated-DNA-[protein]-cysteine S-methyltransferase